MFSFLTTFSYNGSCVAFGLMSQLRGWGKKSPKKLSNVPHFTILLIYLRNLRLNTCCLYFICKQNQTMNTILTMYKIVCRTLTYSNNLGSECPHLLFTIAMYYFAAIYYLYGYNVVRLLICIIFS